MVKELPEYTEAKASMRRLAATDKDPRVREAAEELLAKAARIDEAAGR